jgi:hypothetical protein
MDRYSILEITWLILGCAVVSLRIRSRPSITLLVFLVAASAFFVIGFWVIELIVTPIRTRAWLATLPPGDPAVIGDTGDNAAALLCGWLPAFLLLCAIHIARVIVLRYQKSAARRATGFPVLPPNSKKHE